MMKEQRNKHGKLTRPQYGEFARFELACVGAPCSLLSELIHSISSKLTPMSTQGYMDADHADNEADDFGNLSAIQQKGSSWMIQGLNRSSVFDRRRDAENLDLLWINGNHFIGQNQLVFLDNRKTASLTKRRDQITNIKAFIDVDGSGNIPDFIKEDHPNFKALPLFQISQEDEICSFVMDLIKAQKPPLFGLVLAGGKSIRMGEDKGSISYRDKNQRETVADLLRPFCNEVFISCRTDQNITSDYPILEDRILDLGPMSAILSAFMHNPDAAWMVVACDLPLLTPSSLKQLVDARSVRHVATAFNNPESQFPEPLITIYEPKSYSRMLSFLSQGYSCPRKMLINSDIHLISNENPSEFINVNTPEERLAILNQLKTS
ncbi:MAG: molybdopterin-guanine dinucleotide biosynthesis protein A [Bacteroidia bacterium]|jgi:molybdopterin-guanine dinucleotide biosynthesis protein A